MLDGRVDRVARGARDIGDDGTVARCHLVRERRLARVRAADDRHVDAGVLHALLLGAFDGTRLMQVLDHLVEQVARAIAVNGRQREGVAQPERVELVHAVVAVGRVELVHREDDGLLRLPEQARDLLVVGVDARLAVHDEHDHVGLVRRGEGLVGDGCLEVVVAADLDAARVHERERHAVPVRFVVGAVARDAAHLVHDRVICADDAVDERRLADVRAAHDRHEG